MKYFHSFIKTLKPGILLLFISTFFFSCTTLKKPLVVGVADNFRPVIFKRGNKLSGMEIDFANALGKELRKPVELKEMKFTELIPALESGEIDIIMSGLTVSSEHSKKITFTNPFYEISQMMLIRARDIGKFRKPGNNYFMKSDLAIGVAEGTTGEKLIRKYFPKYKIITFEEDQNGITDLRQGHIDCFFHNSSAVWAFANGQDPQIHGIYWKFAEDKIAWAVNRKNLTLRSKVNKILERWQYNGTIAKIISKWIPKKVIYK
jgi:ABC-type amino acid transport substrate-binding protein